jgi:hypothetical protein
MPSTWLPPSFTFNMGMWALKQGIGDNEKQTAKIWKYTGVVMVAILVEI